LHLESFFSLVYSFFSDSYASQIFGRYEITCLQPLKPWEATTLEQRALAPFSFESSDLQENNFGNTTEMWWENAHSIASPYGNQHVSPPNWVLRSVCLPNPQVGGMIIKYCRLVSYLEREVYTYVCTCWLLGLVDLQIGLPSKDKNCQFVSCN
jgi:hypothetical protein